jgi:error-prone DNA polymerase
MQALPKARPERFEDLVVQVAIIRPGPVQGNAVHPYLRRRAGEEPVTYAHESLRPILEDTLGVILYQEQVMQVAIEVCGYTAVEADIFRKAMGSHRSHAKMQAERPRFIGGAMRTGLTAGEAEAVPSAVPSPSSVSHAPMRRLREDQLRLRRLKRNYPAHYGRRAEQQPMGFCSPAVVISDAKRHRIGSCRSTSTSRPGSTTRAPSGRRRAHVRHPPRTSPGEGDRRAGARDERERRSGYASVRDFVARTRLGEQTVERLISIGAFDWTDAPRRELLWQLRTTLADADPEHPALGLTDDAQRALGASLPPMTAAERVAADYRDTGVAPNLHAVELFRERLAARGVITVADAGRARSVSIRLAGLAVSVQHDREGFVFIALEDETGMINVTLRPKVYQAHRALLHRHPLLVIDGRLQVEGAVLNVVAVRLRSVDETLDHPPERLPLAKQQRMFR